MNPVSKLYLKTFLSASLVFGLLIACISPLLGIGDYFNIWMIIFMSFFYGLFMSLFLVTYQKEGLKNIGVNDFTESNLGVHQARVINVNVSKQEFIEKIKYDNVLNKMKLTYLDNGIKLSSGLTWKSFGEKITVFINPKSEGQYEYTVSSEPKLKTTMFDYGKNLENINRIEMVLFE